MILDLVEMLVTIPIAMTLLTLKLQHIGNFLFLTQTHSIHSNMSYIYILRCVNSGLCGCV